MNSEQFEQIMEVLKEIKELLKDKTQSQTKITVVGNKVQQSAKGLKNNEDFTL
jgi:hypothetical protein